MSATKRDQAEAHAYHRRRVAAAFVGGMPADARAAAGGAGPGEGGEPELGSPLRSLGVGALLAVLVVAGWWAWGLVSPRLEPGWEDAAFVVVRGTGARYVALEGVVHPVRNATSARLALPAGSFVVRDVAAGDLAGVRRGAPLGIEGAPDAPPPRDRLVAGPWETCALGADETATRIGLPTVSTTSPLAVVAVGDRVSLVADGVRHDVVGPSPAAVLRAVGLQAVRPSQVPQSWLAVFPRGTDLGPLGLPGAGRPLPAELGIRGARVGTVVRVPTGAGTAQFVVSPAGELAVLSEVAAAMYALGSGAAADVVDATPVALAGLATAEVAVAPADWPERVLPPATGAPCALLTTSDSGGEPGVRVGVVEPAELAGLPAGVEVVAGGGVLARAADHEVRAGGRAPGGLSLVDEAGSVFGLPGADDETLARLGYRPTDPVPVPAAWLGLLPPGPALTTAAARGGTDGG